MLNHRSVQLKISPGRLAALDVSLRPWHLIPITSRYPINGFHFSSHGWMVARLRNRAYGYLTGQHQLILRRSTSICHCPEGFLFLGYKSKTAMPNTVRCISAKFTAGKWAYQYAQSPGACLAIRSVCCLWLCHLGNSCFSAPGRHQHRRRFPWILWTSISSHRLSRYLPSESQSRGKSFLVMMSALEKECAGIILHPAEKQSFLDQSKGRHSFIFIKRVPVIAFHRYDNICLHSLLMRDASRRMIIHW